MFAIRKSFKIENCSSILMNELKTLCWIGSNWLWDCLRSHHHKTRSSTARDWGKLWSANLCLHHWCWKGCRVGCEEGDEVKEVDTGGNSVVCDQYLGSGCRSCCHNDWFWPVSAIRTRLTDVDCLCALLRYHFTHAAPQPCHLGR